MGATPAGGGNFLTGPNGHHFIPGTSGTLTGLADTLLGPVTGGSGDGLLAQLNLTATTAGAASLSGANILLFDSSGALMPVTPPTRQLQVNAAAIQLTPYWPLLALGLVLLGLWRLRRVQP